MNLTRGQSGTEGQSHEAEEGVQLVLEYDAESPADIIYDLIANYTDLPTSWLPLSDWQEEMTLYINRLYSAEIAEPTGVKDLIDELIEQVGLVMWSDLPNQFIRLTALRPVSTTVATYDTDRIMETSFDSKEQEKKRVSQVWTYIGLRNPLADLDDENNYKSVVVSLDETGADEEYGNLPAIKKVYSRWIATANRQAASRLNALLLSRYRDPPRLFGFDVYREDTPPVLGRGCIVSHWNLQDATGAVEQRTAQVVSLEPQFDRFSVEAEELDFSFSDEQVIFIDEKTINVNLRDLYDMFFGSPTTYDTITFVIESGVCVGTPWRAFNQIDIADLSDALENANFELGDTGWTWGGSGSGEILSTAGDPSPDPNIGPEPYDGAWAAYAGFTSNPNSTQKTLTNDARIPVVAGQGVGFEARAMSKGGWGALEDAPWVRVEILWYDGALVFLSSTNGEMTWGYDALNEWVRIIGVGVAPAGAEYCTLSFRFAWGDGNFIVDAASPYVDNIYAINVGDWPEGPDLVLINNGEIRAGGGRGGDGPDEVDQTGIDGAHGVYTRYPITIENNGVIAGGGGGGGGWENGLQTGGGGGGAGYSQDEFGNQTFAPGGTGIFPQESGDDGLVETGGDGHAGTIAATNDGGDAGQDGETPNTAAAFGNGGSAGYATDGDSYITFSIEGTILGDRVN
jgi:hypothetical protein